jgi:hypothetical protein
MPLISETKLSPIITKPDSFKEETVVLSITSGTPKEIGLAPHLEEFVCPKIYFLQDYITELSSFIFIPS